MDVAAESVDIRTPSDALTTLSPPPGAPIGPPSAARTHHRREPLSGTSAWHPRENPGLFVAVAFGVLLPLVIAGVTGNLSIPHNDAWAYSRIGQTFGRTGHVELVGWNRSGLVGQFVVLGPLARSLVAQQVFVALLAGVLLWAVFDLTRPSVGVRRAGWAAAIVALWPGFGLLATSFMPDIPALAGALLCLSLGVRASRRSSPPLYLAALCAGLWGATIREQAAAAPATVVLCALADRRFRTARRLTVVLAGAAVTGAAFLAFSAWHDGLPKADPPTYTLATYWTATTFNLLLHSWFTLALPLAPVVLFTARPWRWHRPSQVATALAAFGAVISVHDFKPANLFLGNYLDAHGAYMATTWLDGNLRAVIPTTDWNVVVGIACVSGALLVGLLTEKLRQTRSDRHLGVFTIVTVVGTLATNLAAQDVYDRYLMALAPGILAVVLAPKSRRGASRSAFRQTSERLPAASVAAALTGLVIAVLSSAITVNAFAYDSARWQTATAIAGSGVPEDRIDAGLEWLGYHSPNGVINRYPSSGQGWEALFSPAPSCRVLAVALHPDRPWKLVGTVSYHTFLTFGESTLYVYSTGAANCP